MKKYRAKFNPERKGVYAISLVDEPAMEGDFIQFKKDKIQFSVIDKEKSRVMGLILEPDKEIIRFNEESQEYYTVEFGVQDVKDVAYNFQRQSNQNNSTLQHDGKAIEGVTFVELWLVEDSKIDKSAKFGFDYPVGSWVGVMDIQNESVMEEIRLGKYRGFSIDALMEFEEIKLNKLDMDVKNEGTVLEFLKDLPNKIALAMKPKEVEVKKDADGKVDLSEHKNTKGEDVVLSKEVAEAVIKEAEKLKLYHEGKEHDKDKVKMEDKDDEDKEKVKMADDEMVASILSDLVTKIQEMLAPMEEASVELKKEVEALKLTVTKQAEELVEFGKQPATPSIKKVPAQLEYSKMSNLEKFNYNKEN